VLAVAYWRLRGARGSQVGLFERVPRWLIAVNVLGIIALMLGIIAANM